jgi:hypothetical protein
MIDSSRDTASMRIGSELTTRSGHATVPSTTSGSTAARRKPRLCTRSLHASQHRQRTVTHRSAALFSISKWNADDDTSCARQSGQRVPSGHGAGVPSRGGAVLSIVCTTVVRRRHFGHRPSRSASNDASQLVHRNRTAAE